MRENYSLEGAANNCATLLKVSVDEVKSQIELSINGLSGVQKFFVFRSLENQTLLSDCSFSHLPSQKRLDLIEKYVQAHRFMGVEFPSYEAVRYVFTPTFYNQYRKRKINSMIDFVTLAFNEGFDKSANCLFPKQSLTDFSSYDLFWIIISSAWVETSYKKYPLVSIPNNLANSYNINRNSLGFKTFMGNCSPQKLSEAVRYTPEIVKVGKSNPTWSNYKKVPIKNPLNCLAPLGLDFLAYQYYGYVDGVGFTDLWSSDE
jgi:hypothetical protein